jgi:hypothetical protein
MLLAVVAHGAVSIHEAAMAGDVAAVQTILQTNAAAVLLTNDMGETALHLGAGASSPTVVKALLEAKSQVNAQAAGFTALHYAINYRRVIRLADRWAGNGIEIREVFRLALDSVANPQIESVGGRTIRDPAVMLHRALTNQDDAKEIPEELKVVELLLAAGPDVKLANPPTSLKAGPTTTGSSRRNDGGVHLGFPTAPGTRPVDSLPPTPARRARLAAEPYS